MRTELSAAVKRASIFVIAIAMLMDMLDATILNTSLPQIAKSLHSNPIELKVAITTYLLTLGIFIPASGWLVECIGERHALIIAILIFLLSSVGCGLAINLPMLTLFRLGQGVGGAFLAPVARLILLKVYGRHNTVHAMARVSSLTITGLALGPVVGGALTTYLSWRWIFFVNIPFGLLGIVLIKRYLPVLSKPHRRPFDFIGFVLLGGALGMGLFFIDVLVQPMFSISEKIAVLATALLLAVGYLWHSTRAKFLLLDFTIFNNQIFRLTALGSLSARFTMSTAPFLIPLMLQASYGYTALHAGLLAVPSTIGALTTRPYISRWIDNFGYRKLLLTNTLMLIIVYLSYTINAFHLRIGLLIVQQLIFGFGMAIQYTTMNSLAYRNLHDDQISRGTSIYSAIVQLSASFGIAFAALVMIITIGTEDLSHQIPLIAFKIVFLVQALFLMLAFLLFSRLDVANRTLNTSLARPTARK